MSPVRTIPYSGGVTLVTFRPEVSSICSVGNLPFYGEAVIEYRPSGQLLEFESLQAFVKSLGSERLTIEDVTDRIFDEITAALGDIPLRVSVSARTTVHAPAGATKERGF